MLFFDFYVYYAAAVVTRRGGDVYDPAVFERAMREVGWPAGRGVAPFAYPPWSLELLAPFGYLPLRAALVAWCALQVICLVAAARLALALLRPAHPELAALTPPRLALALVAFVPAAKLLLAAQVTGIPLVAVLLAAACLARGRAYLAGALLAVACVKPQLLAPAIAACVVDAVVRGRPALLAGLASALAAEVLAGAALHPAGLAVVPSYLARTFALATVPGIAHSSPALAIANLVGARWPVAAFPVAGVAIAVALAIRARVTAERLLCTLVPLSVVTAPYLWTHDLVLLLPVWLALAASAYRRWRERTANLALVAQAVVCAAPVAAAREDLFAVFAPLVWGAYLLWPARAPRAAAEVAASSATAEPPVSGTAFRGPSP